MLSSKQFQALSSFLLLFNPAVSLAGPGIRLKTRVIEPVEDRAAYVAGPLKRRATAARAGRSHYLLHFEGGPTPEQLAALRDLGATVTASVPDTGLMVSASDGFRWSQTGANWVGRLAAVDKISPALEALVAPEAYVVEFHADADMEQARELVAEHGLTLVEHPDLLPNQLVVAGEQGVVVRLSEWDEVAYIFPASSELVRGEAVSACAGAVTDQGWVAQYARVGNGWPQQNGLVELFYSFGALTAKLPPETARAEIVRGLVEWSKYGRLRFSPGGGPGTPRTVHVFFAEGAHGDSSPFDGQGRTLAHTYYPAPPNPEPIAGDMHLDDAEPWRVGASIDLFSVALHEAGHALGLGHSDQPGAVMYPYYRMTGALAADDIAAIRDLYGAQDAPPPVAPVISITSPAGATTTTASSVTIQGTASSGAGGLRVTWGNSRGGSGVATGTSQWSIPNLALSTGENRITVAVTDAANRSASASVVVIRNTVAQPPSRPDSVAPALTITSPAFTVVATSAASITIAGTASDNVGVMAVRWSVSGGAETEAAGTANWRATVPLRLGTNQVVVRAYDAAGNFGWRSLTVVRR